MSDAHCSTDELGLPGAGNGAVGGSARALDTVKGTCPAERLPPELLCAALSYLSLRSKIRASQVSRYWRAAALESPELWATISMTCSTGSRVEKATTLMSRAGSIADVAIVCYYPDRKLDLAVLLAEMEGQPMPDVDAVEDEENDFHNIILPYLHKIRSLRWSSSHSVRSPRHAAPFLEKLHVMKKLVIQPDFLSGGSDRLRTLRCGIAQLPISCTVLSFIVDLRIDDLQVDPVTGVPRLFDLFPRLESLNLCSLRHIYSRQLLEGPAPASLRVMTLKSRDPEWEMSQHFADLHTPALRMISIDITASQRTTLGRLPAPLLRDAAGLHIREPFNAEGSWFVVTLPGAREYSIALPELCVPDLAQQIIACGAARLQTIRTLNVTIDLLEHFVAVAHAVPALETFTVHLETFQGSLAGPPRHPDTEISGWDALTYLEAVLDAAPQLRALVLDAHASWDAPGAELDIYDAEFILSYLEFLYDHTGPVPEITVRGFAAETVRDVDLDELPIRFDTESFGKVSSYWPFQVVYDDH